MYKPYLTLCPKPAFACMLLTMLFCMSFSAFSTQNTGEGQTLAKTEPSQAKSISASNNDSASNIENDFLLPVTASSREQSLDGRKMTSIFKDSVVIKQGSLQILADQVEADATAGKGKEVITATGRPASYQQQLEDGSVVIASANEIKYNVELQTISLTGNATIKQKDVTVTSDSITFDMAKQQIMASTDANSEAAVTTVLSPGAFSTDTKTKPADEPAEDKP